ncbi:unnamed protein product [Paramecium octaurelia]|uniref:Uncharacterized protein n=1 Tax=Paramecium octaurelia TaxID=43137 RepID=A0A8S1UBD3_PAROT|nr:unnamed protein product [Paramecium octaurelia]
MKQNIQRVKSGELWPDFYLSLEKQNSSDVYGHVTLFSWFFDRIKINKACSIMTFQKQLSLLHQQMCDNQDSFPYLCNKWLLSKFLQSKTKQ